MTAGTAAVDRAAGGSAGRGPGVHGDGPVHLPGLNGIRAIAALAVVVSHVTLRLGAFGLDPNIFGTTSDGKPRSLDLAGFGVSMFFALSGFLITYLLVLEKRRSPVAIGKFYARRALRIWPLYYAYVALCVVSYVAAHVEHDPSLLPYYLLLAPNVPLILGVSLPLLGHYWSLGVEEQFYVFWPWITRLSEERMLMVSILIAVLAVTAKVLLHALVPGSLLESAIHVSRFHCMLLGAIAALLLLRGGAAWSVTALCSVPVQATAWAMFALVATNRFHLASVIDNELVAAMAVVIVVGQVTRRGLLSLDNRAFDLLGRLSYGIYVIHPLIIFWLAESALLRGPASAWRYLAVYCSVLVLTLGAAHLSYHRFEKVFLRVKARTFTIISSAPVVTRQGRRDD